MQGLRKGHQIKDFKSILVVLRILLKPKVLKKHSKDIYFISNFLLLIIMESSAFFYTIFLWCLLLSITGYSIYVGFGPPSKELRDPFEDHED